MRKYLFYAFVAAFCFLGSVLYLPSTFASSPPCQGDVARAFCVFCEMNTDPQYQTCNTSSFASHCFATEQPDIIVIYGYVYDISACKTINAWVPCTNGW